MRSRRALILSDLHFGWSICRSGHEELLRILPEAVDDAELIVLNGDIFDFHRGFPGNAEMDIAHAFVSLCMQYEREGRRVVYVEGNHDDPQGLLGFSPQSWYFDWEGAHGERVRVLHGHRFDSHPFRHSPYEGLGRHLLRAENHLYSRAAPLRSAYSMGPGWFVGGVGLAEDLLWGREFPLQVTPLLSGVDVLLFGHFHFGPARRFIRGVNAYRTGAWVSGGHLGSVDRMLRYRDGRFERIGIEAGRIRAFHDGR